MGVLGTSVRLHEAPLKACRASQTLAGLLLALHGLNSLAASDTFTVVKVNVATEKLGIYWQDDAGRPIRSFERLSALLGKRNKTLVFAMNAGMYHADSTPVGLLVVNGKQLAPLNLSNGSGNFYLKPNGVFFTSNGKAYVVDAEDYKRRADQVPYATQSGPLLLKDGRINPAFNAQSNSRLIRNGVCARDSEALFVISEKPVNFHEFASFFLNELHCTDALYLDGVVSSLYARSQGRSDSRAELGPIFAVIE